MGAEPYEYTVPYQTDIRLALDQLRSKVFKDGEFRGAELNPATPEEALENMDADGTASILDIYQVATEPDYFCAAPYASQELVNYFGTEQPTRADVEKSDDLWDDLERGQARYVILYQDGEPSEIHFVGYSFD